MARFLVEHHHTEATCPASNPEMARALAGHIRPANAAKFGVEVLSDCVVEGEHTLLLLVESESRDKVEAFAAPFQQAGPTAVKAATTCEVVAGRARD